MDVEVLTRAELIARCGTVDRARGEVASGWWRHPARDAYVDASLPDTPDVRLAVLRAVVPADVAVSHRAALWALGRDVLRQGAIDMTVPRGRHLLSRPGQRMHIAALPDSELVECSGLLLTSAARALIDVARTERLPDAVAFGDEALRSGATTPDRVAECLSRAAGLRGVLAARTAVPLLDGRSESPMESRLRISLYVGGVRGLDVQFDVYDDEGHVGRSDMHLHGVLVEYDGREQRLGKAVFVDERVRQNRLADTGLQLRRYTARDVYGRPPAVLAASLLRAVALAQSGIPVRAWTGPDTLRAPVLRPLASRAEQSAVGRRAA